MTTIRIEFSFFQGFRFGFDPAHTTRRRGDLDRATELNTLAPERSESAQPYGLTPTWKQTAVHASGTASYPCACFFTASFRTRRRSVRKPRRTPSLTHGSPQTDALKYRPASPSAVSGCHFSFGHRFHSNWTGAKRQECRKNLPPIIAELRRKRTAATAWRIHPGHRRHRGIPSSSMFHISFSGWSGFPAERPMRPLKNATCVVGLHPSSLRRTGCTPHSSRFARLASHRFWPACPAILFIYGLLWYTGSPAAGRFPKS